MKVLIICGIWFATACHAVPQPSDRFAVIQRQGYAYQRLNDGEYVIAAMTVRDLNKALLEIGCSRDYVCMVEPRGDLYVVLQRAKGSH